MDQSLFKKFQLKDEFSVLMLNSNPDIHPLFDGIRLEFSGAGDHSYDSVIFFSKNESELSEILPIAESNRKPEGQLWLNYPKKSGKIKTDLNRDITAAIVDKLGFDPVRLISLNTDWSSLRLVKKSERKTESKFGQDAPGVDRTTKTVIPPDDLQKELDANAEAAQFFEGLAFSHKREYVTWIHEAKKSETRERRIKKTIEMLTEGKKSR